MTDRRIETIAVGDEIVTGSIQDTNFRWLAERLSDLGWAVARHTVVGDTMEEMTAAFREAGARADLVLVSGGLGPTRDDRTRDAAAEAFGAALERSEEAENHLRALFAALGRRMPEVNLRQALLPAGATPLVNHFGTAWGFSIQAERGVLTFVPGVPREFQGMVEEHFLPSLGAAPVGRAVVWVRCVGQAESRLEEILGGVEPEGGTLGFYPRFPEVHLKCSVTAPSAAGAGEAAEAFARAVEERVGASAYGRGERTLEEVTVDLLRERGWTVALAESYTGGLLAVRLTHVPGCSKVFDRGLVCYSNRSKREVLGVRAETLDRFGAVSEETAREMAEGVRRSAGTTFAVATTGIAGPGGGSAEKPVGSGYVAFASEEGAQVHPVRWGGSRTMVQELAASLGLDLIRRGVLARSPRA